MQTRDYTKIFRDGICVCVHVGGWNGAIGLSPQDLGLKSEDVIDAIELGKMLLIPKDRIHKFGHIEGQARNVVDDNSFPFPIGNSKFVPRKKYGKIIARLTELQSLYKAEAEQFVADYPQLREQMLPKFREAAEKAFEVMNPTTIEFGVGDDPEELRNKREDEKSEYVGKFIERIVASYPAVDTIRSRFYLDWDQFQTAAPDMLLTSAEDVLQTEEAQKAAAEEAHRQTSSRVEEFVNDVVKVLRAEATKTCGRIATAIKEGKVIRSTTVNSLKAFIEKFRDMNFVGDQTIEAQLNAIQKELLDAHPEAEFLTNVELKEELGRKLNLVVQEAGKLSEQDLNSVTGDYKRKVNW